MMSATKNSLSNANKIHTSNVINNGLHASLINVSDSKKETSAARNEDVNMNKLFRSLHQDDCINKTVHYVVEITAALINNHNNIIVAGM